MSDKTITKTYTIREVLEARPKNRHLKNLKFMVSPNAAGISAAGLRRTAAKLLHGRDSNELVFSKNMRDIKGDNFLISEIIS